MNMRRFSAWSTYVFLQTETRIEAAEAITRARLDLVDRAVSRFRDDSELTALNANPGSWVPASPVLIGALEVAIMAAAATDGLVDPCLGRALVELGYDRDIGILRRDGARHTPRPVGARRDAWREIEVDRSGRVRIPRDVTIDLGATAKAWAADLIAEEIAEDLGTAVILSIGGDVRTAGPPACWPVAVAESPDGVDRPEATLVELSGGGLATSSTTARRWQAGGVAMHHLLDPRTGAPVTGPWRTVTATGPTCTAANVATTAALVLQADAEGWLAERGVDARLVDTEGRVSVTGRWPVETERAS